ncbi:MAG: hypothetical protein ACR2LJ_12170 [Acidimicrobiales bacterium]
MTRSRRFLRAGASLVGLGAVVGGVPALLIAVVGWPLPRRLPTTAQVSSALGDGWRPDERFVLCFLAALVWLLWAQLLRHVLSQFRIQTRVRHAAIAAGDENLPQAAYATASRHGLAPRLAGWLIGGLMLAAPLAPSAAMAAPSPRIPVVLMATGAMADPLTGPAPASTPAAPPSATNTPTYIVHTWAERRDCLWNIADRYLGDAFRWTEIRDLNAQRVQADGRRLGDDPSSWVYPGWELVLPADATGADVIGARTTPSAPTPAPAASPSSPQTAASPPPVTAAGTSRTAVAPPATAAAPATTAGAPTTAAPATPVVTAESPNTGAAHASARSAQPAGSSQPAPRSTATPAAHNSGSIVSVGPWALRVAMAGALGLPIFALAGWLARLSRGRASQASRARPGRDVVRPDPEVEPLERVARMIAVDQAEEWITAALRALTAELGEACIERAPELHCIRAGEMGLEVLLAEPFPTAPSGWETGDGGYVWRLPADVELDELQRRGDGFPAIAPALVSLGATPEGPILGDLESFAALSVEGDVDRARAFLAGAALELESASWANGVELRVYGLSGFEGLEGVAVADGVELAREARGMAELFAPGPGVAGSALGSRVAGGPGGEPWYPMVVLIGPGADRDIVEDLVATATMSCGVAVAGMLGDVETKWQLIVGPDGAAVLKPLGMGMRMSGVADPRAAAGDHVDATLAGPAVDEAWWGDGAPDVAVVDEVEVDEAMWGANSTGGGVVDEVGADETVASQATAPHRDISAADEPEPVPAVDRLALDQSGLDEANIGLAIGAMVAVAEEHDVAAPIPLVAPARSRRARLRRRQDCEVWVSILRREPEVIGSAHAFRSRRKLAEVLVYLVVYGTEHPVAGTQLRTDCWCPKPDAATPGMPPRLKEISMDSLHQAMSRLRKQLGEGGRGWHLPAAADGAYRPGLEVGCDWTLFQALAAAGTDAVARHETARAIAAWREALELVAGDPFADVVPLGLYVFAETRPLITDIRLAVAKVADDLARLTRESDPPTSVWATEQGHLVLPTQLGLFDHKMAAFAELGDVEGVKRVLEAKCWAHEQLDPDGGVPPETLELYRHLLVRAQDGSRVGASSSRS